MARARTRFMVTVGGVGRQLISVGETADQGLNIILSTGATGDHPLGRAPIIQRKYSLHPSPNTDGYLFKIATIFEGGDKVESTVFIEDGKEGFFFPIVGTSVSMIVGPEKPNLRAKDRVINIGEYEPGQSSLLYVLFAMDAARPFDPSVTTARPIFEADFKLFRLLLFPAFLPFPSAFSGSTLTFNHTPGRWNEAPIEVPERGVPNWIPPALAPVILRGAVAGLKPKILSHLSSFYGSGKVLAAASEFFARTDARTEELNKEAEEFIRHFTGVLPSSDGP